MYWPFPVRRAWMTRFEIIREAFCCFANDLEASDNSVLSFTRFPEGAPCTLAPRGSLPRIGSLGARTVCELVSEQFL